MTDKLIALDWGTTSFRGYLMGKDGRIIQQISADQGILAVGDQDFKSVFLHQLSRFDELNPEWPVVASGMITSKLGWVETPYLESPAHCTALSDGMIPHGAEPYQIWFVPGMSQTLPDADVMRGEETQLAGLETRGQACAIMPGTHSKWVLLEDERVNQFKTFMTGEVYSLLNQYSILRSPADTPWHAQGFEQGVKEGFESVGRSQSLLSKLFSVRARPLLGVAETQATGSFLSGLLIGSEIADAWQNGYADQDQYILIGSDQLAAHYQLAMTLCGIPSVTAPSHLAARGLFKLAHQKGLI